MRIEFLFDGILHFTIFILFFFSARRTWRDEISVIFSSEDGHKSKCAK